MDKKLDQFSDRNEAEKVFFNRSEMSRNFTYRVWYVIGAVVLTGLLLIVLWLGTEVVLLVFAGLLLAVFLRGIGNWISAKTGISESWAVAIVLLSIIGLTVLGIWFLYPSLRTQFDQLFNELPQAVQSVREQLAQTSIGRRVLEQIPLMQEIGGQSSNILSRLTGYFSTVLGAFVSIVVVIAVGIYFAFDPKVYYNGFLKLIPASRQERARKILDTIGYTLEWWLLGRLAVMTINGILTTVGLWLLGIPLAIPLGILTGLLNFIPNIGPFLAAIPAIILALMISPTTALYVALFYLVLQGLEGYVLEPLAQQKAISMPPVLVIAVQLFFGILFGFIGVLLAVPITAIVFIIVKMIYVEDFLGHSVEIQGRKKVEENAG